MWINPRCGEILDVEKFGCEDIWNVFRWEEILDFELFFRFGEILDVEKSLDVKKLHSPVPIVRCFL